MRRKDLGIPAIGDLAGRKEADSTKLADLLELRASAPDAFAQLLAVNWRQVKNWER